MKTAAFAAFSACVLTAPADLIAQVPDTTPFPAAITYALTVHDQSGSDKTAVLDTEMRIHGPGLSGTAHSISIRSDLADASARLRIPSGSLKKIMSCPAAPPPPEKFGRDGHHGCVFSDPSAVVVQVDDPIMRPDGVLVTVAIWEAHQIPERDRYFVTLTKRQIRLSRAEQGRWRAAGAEWVSSSHW